MEEIFFEIPDGVDVRVDDRKVVVSGKNGTIEKSFNDPRFNDDIEMESNGKTFVVKYNGEKRKPKAMAGTIRAHVKNMSNGVLYGYKYTMHIVYTHFPITVAIDKNKVQVKNFLGERGIRVAKIVGNTKIKIDKESIELTGPDVEIVSQTAANIEKACKLTKRDRRIFQDGIYMHKNELMK